VAATSDSIYDLPVNLQVGFPSGSRFELVANTTATEYSGEWRQLVADETHEDTYLHEYTVHMSKMQKRGGGQGCLEGSSFLWKGLVVAKTVNVTLKVLSNGQKGG